MANDNIIGIAMELDVTDLKAGLQETKKSITTANKEFAAATSGMDDWTKTTEGLNAKLDQLDTVLKNQKKNVAGYEAELKKLEDAGRGNSEEARRLRDKLLDAQAAVGKTEKATRKYKTQLENVEASSRDVTSETTDMSRALKRADDATVDLKGGFTVLKGAMAGLVTSGITALVGGLKSAVEESRELRKELGRLDTAFIDNGFTSDQARDAFVDLNSVLGDTGRTEEALQHLSKIAKDEKELGEYTNILTGVYGKFGNSLPTEGLAEAINHTSQLGEVQGVLADALEWSGVTTDDFNAKLAECGTEEERSALIRKTLNGLYSKASDTYKEVNADLIDAQEAETEYALAQAEVGAKIEPVLTSIKRGFTDILNAILDLTAGTDLSGLQASIKGAFEWFISTALPAIKSGIDFVIKHQDLILGLIAGIAAGFAAWKVVGIITSVVTAMKGWMAATQGMTVAQRLLNLAMSMNPIGIVITLIAALVAAFVVLWNKSEAFRNFWIGLWEKIKSVADTVIKAVVGFFTGAWDKIKKVWSVVEGWFKAIWEGIKAIFTGAPAWLKGKFSDAWEGIKGAWNGVKGWFGDVWNGIKNAFSNVTTWFKGKFSDAWNGIKSAWSSVGTWFSDIVDTIFGFFTKLPHKMLDIGKDMMNGLIDGVKSMINKVKNAVTGAVDSAISGVKKFLGIASPSKLMRDEIGKMMGAGVGEGLMASASDVVKKANTFSKKVSAGLTDKVGAIKTGAVASVGRGATSTSVTNNYTQVINAPKQPSKLELYRQSKNLLNLKGVY